MEFYISPQGGQFYMINVLENQWLSVTYRRLFTIKITGLLKNSGIWNRVGLAKWLVCPPLTR